MKKSLKNAKTILRFFDQNLYGKLTFIVFTIPDYSRKYLSQEDNTNFLQQYITNFGGGGVVAPPPTRRYCFSYS